MRIVFMGTPAIAATCLKRLLETEHEIVGVYTKPDTPKNRGMKLSVSEVKALAAEHGLPVYQPATFKEDSVVSELAALQPELICVVAYGKILPQRVLEIPKYGCVNIHASILPQLRGSAPVQWAVLNGLEETGVTAMYMAAEMDAGDIIEIAKTPIGPNETSEELMEQLAELGAALLCKTVSAIQDGTVTRTPQDHEKATYAPMLTKDLSAIDWSNSARQICNQVRGLIPWPVAAAEFDGKRFKLFQVEQTGKRTDQAPGALLGVTKQGLEVACGGGAVLLVTQLQAEGGKRMSACDYFRGHPLR